MTSWGTEHIELLACGTDSAIYQKRFLNGTWSPSWTSLGGTFVYEPVAVCMKPNWINIFAVETDGKIYVKWSDSVTWGLQRPNVGGHECSWTSHGETHYHLYRAKHTQFLCTRQEPCLDELIELV
ncbi:hypothetical protein M422DRAFT_55355 [Sphaerobolus stellatus SS14]|uniref:Uncharacterized protein n=1 Tax=Sphaerobolus stellatus (strain SS14) TaxID=990650 RepID=A0A0C9UMW5_SPHS4|nr:hypothetical protein M422DRAFT_55355 [Sphaerobolus stellatus SS14]